MADQEQQENQTTAEPDPSKWDEQQAVTGRPNDTPLQETDPALPNSTFAERAKAAKKAEAKAVDRDTAENKAVRSGRASKKDAG
jgi:hypothetical protein